MKRLAKVFSMFLALFLLFLVPLTYGCNKNDFPEFKTAYTEQQHKKRVETLLMQMEEHFNNPIKTITMHTVYSYYTEDPEYIIITIEHENYHEGSFSRQGVTYNYQTKNSHTVLQIINDEYYYTPLYAYADVYRRPKLGFCYGLSPYEICGHINDKKFYEYEYRLSAVRDTCINTIYRPDNIEAEWEYDFLGEAPRNERNFKQSSYEYIKETENHKKLLYNSRVGRYSFFPRIKFYSW